MRGVEVGGVTGRIERRGNWSGFRINRLIHTYIHGR